MPQRCTVCDHAARAEIDRALVEGRTSAATVARRYDLVKTSVERHAKNHLPAALAASQRAAEVAQGDTLLAKLEAMTAETQAVLRVAKREKDHHLTLKAIGHLEKQLELQARLLGELRDGPTVNVFVGQEWHAAVAVILRVLAPHPALRLEVASALRALGAVDGREGQAVTRVA